MHKIAVLALSFLGQKEIAGNKGFQDKAFEKKMRGAGFYTLAAWCGFFCRLCYKEAEQFKVLKLISGSAVLTMKQAAAAGNWHTEAKSGAVVVYRMFKNGKPKSTGHMGIVTEVHGDKFDTVEGNTTEYGGREGLVVARRLGRSYKWDTQDGLRLMGFIYPEDLENSE